MCLIYQENLDPNIFLLNGKSQKFSCVYQIWFKRSSIFDNGIDLREKKPSLTIQCITTWQHNATPRTRKYIDERWDICVYRQGYKDYSKIFYKTKDYSFIKDKVYNTSDQFFFIKIEDKSLREIIEKIDFSKLANQALSTPGFGKQDFVSEVLKLQKESN